MKKAFLLITGISCFSLLHAQLKQGTIIYDQKINMHRTLADERMKAMVPEFRTTQYQLEFSDSVSLYKAVPEDEAPDPFAGGGGARVMMMNFRSGVGGDMYKNFSQQKSVQATELAGKNYLIIDSIRQQPWKLTNDTKQILGYNCHKATRKLTVQSSSMRRMVINGSAPAQDTTTKTVAAREIELEAWYADDIVSPAGPENYGQLPGVILELNMDKGATVYTATEIRKTVDLKNLKEPKKGKVVTQQEYSSLQKEMMGNGISIQGGTIRFGGGE